MTPFQARIVNILVRSDSLSAYQIAQKMHNTKRIAVESALRSLKRSGQVDCYTYQYHVTPNMDSHKNAEPLRWFWNLKEKPNDTPQRGITL